MKIVSVEQMRKIEESADVAGLPYEQMMRNAGEGIAGWVSSHHPSHSNVIGLIGSGNNGGDTLIALGALSEKGYRTDAFLFKERGEDPLISQYQERGGNLIDLRIDNNLDYFTALQQQGAIILDGILGTGFRLPLQGEIHQLMAAVHNSLTNAPKALIIAVDCPSGIDCDTGEVSDVTLPADHTLTMVAAKRGILLHPARSYAGDIHLIDIGIDTQHIERQGFLPEIITDDLAASCLPERPDKAHKGTFGTCLIFAGSSQFVGAAYLTGKAAYRSGCGLVNMVTCQTVYDHLAGKLIEAVWTTIPDSENENKQAGNQEILDQVAKADAIVIGPGWGVSDPNLELLDQLLTTIPEETPLLIDADGLNLLARMDQWWKRLPKQTILTPHPGEMAVLSGKTTAEIQSDRWKIAKEFGLTWGVHLILKGAITVVAMPDGALFMCPISEPALATAGSGDVLSGIIGGLLAQGSTAKKASISGVWVHARAGTIAGEYLGTDFSVTAVDVLDGISETFSC